MTFAARQDLFEPGFFAGFPAAVPAPVRRALWRIDISRYLDILTLRPVRSAALIRLVDIVRAEPGLDVSELPEGIAADLRGRAAELELPEPKVAGDVDRGEYADLLWRTYGRSELGGPEVDPAWRRHAAAAGGDFRTLVEDLRAGGILQLFPEGWPSANGEIGPLQRGLSALVRRGSPTSIQPVGIAYDPLTRGRTHAFVSYETPFPPPSEDVEAAVLDRLKLAVPLTAGQVVAAAVVEETEPGEALLDDAVEAAREEGRSLAPELVDPGERRRRLAEARAAAAKADRTVLEYLAREYRSARER
jgi:hypothetical protein